MNTTEKIVLDQIVKNLEKSMDWKIAGHSKFWHIEDWIRYAGKMKTVIGTSTQIMKAMISDENDPMESMKEAFKAGGHVTNWSDDGFQTKWESFEDWYKNSKNSEEK